MVTLRRTAAPLLALALGAASVAGCGGGGEALTVYSGREFDLIAPILQIFAEDRGIDLDIRDGTTADLALQIQAEGANSPADVFLSQSPGAVGFLDAQGLLAELPESVLSAVPAEDHAEDGRWVGITGRVRTMVYDTREFADDELPGSILDLPGDERFRGRIGIAPGNASFQDFVTSLRSELGDDATLEFLRGLDALDPEIYPNNVSILEAVNRGEIAVGLINHYYWFENAEAEPDQPSALHFFDEGDLGSMLLVTAASVLASSDQQDLAAELLAFLLSEEAQRYFAEETLEYPLAAGVEPVEGMFPLEDIVSDRVAFAELSDLASTIALIEESGLPD